MTQPAGRRRPNATVPRILAYHHTTALAAMHQTSFLTLYDQHHLWQQDLVLGIVRCSSLYYLQYIVLKVFSQNIYGVFLFVTVGASSSSAPIEQMALEYQAALFKNAPRDGKMHPLVGLVLPMSPGCEDPSHPPPPASPSSDKTDNSDHSNCSSNSPDMRREDERLKTFDKWPLTFLSPQTLAKNGFYYLGRGDEVRCAFCKVEIMKWEEGDDPAKDHQLWAPQCPFLRRHAGVGNVPLDCNGVSATAGRDECGSRGPPASAPRLPGPVHPTYAAEAARLRSFRDWPRSLRQKPEELAQAGFFYTGQGDKTKCFYCDGGLKDWEDDDVPWEQHARWFSRCAYVQLVKGRDYVQKVMSEAAVVPAPAPPAPVPSEEDKKPPSPAAPATIPAVEKPSPPPSPEPTVSDDKLCKICFVEERNICFVPCGHVVACAKCALSTDKCPMCRRTFVDAVRLYYS